MKKFFVIVFLFAALTAKAQHAGFWGKVNHFLMFVYQPSPGFSLGLFTTGQKAGFDVDAVFKIKYGDGTTLPCSSTYSLSENLCKKIGLDLGYGNVGFG